MTYKRGEMRMNSDKHPGLQANSQDLQYEWWMLNELADRIPQAFGSRDRVLSNALLESFLIHARCLRDFLYKRDPRVKRESRGFDDIFVDHFFSSIEKVLEWLPKETEDPSKLNYLVGKKIAHFTGTRQTDGAVKSHEWNVELIRKDLNQRMRMFSKEVEAGRLPSSWGEMGSKQTKQSQEQFNTAFNIGVTTTYAPGPINFLGPEDEKEKGV